VELANLLLCRVTRGNISLAARKHGKSRSRDLLVSRKILILGNLLRRAAAARYRRLLRLAGVEWGVVAHIGLGAPQTLNQIAWGMGLEKAQLSRTVSKLVSRGLVAKQTNPQNNREVLISLTRDGWRNHLAIRAAGAAANAQLLAGLPRKDLVVLVGGLEYLTLRARNLLRTEQVVTRRAPIRARKK
jgi:DNA-binding MarR family transcriptional regulator